MVLKNKRDDDVTQLKTTHVYTDVAQGCLKVNTDKTWPKHSTKIALIWSKNTEQQMKYP